MDTKFSMALHIMLFIAETRDIASSEALAKSINTNSSHVRKIIALLKKAHLITSNQGKTGFYLAKHPQEIDLAMIYRAIYPSKKVLNIHAEPNLACPLGAHVKSVIQPVFDQVENSILAELTSQTLAQLIEQLYIIGGKL